MRLWKLFCFVFCFVLLESILCVLSCDATHMVRKLYGISEFFCLRSFSVYACCVYTVKYIFCRLNHLTARHWVSHRVSSEQWTHTAAQVKRFSSDIKRNVSQSFSIFIPNVTHKQTHAMVHLLLSLLVVCSSMLFFFKLCHRMPFTLVALFIFVKMFPMSGCRIDQKAKK